MTLLLAGDIGGTKTILRLVQAEPKPDSTLPTLLTLHEATYASREFSSLVPMVHKFIEQATEKVGQPCQAEKACFGIAGPVVNQTSDLTNLGWSLAADDLCHKLNIPLVSLINDFAAVGYGVLGLGVEDIYTLQQGVPQMMAPVAIIGAGTGLGQGFLIPHADGYRTYASEGGHADFAPRSELEFQLLKYLRDRYNIERISAERVVSGMGIVAIYQFLRDRHTSEESPEMTQIYRTWQSEIGQERKTVDLAAEISKAAHAETDYLSQETMKLFIDAYGAEAGNLALKLLPYGGLYVAGGIAMKNLDLLQEGTFLRAFLQKGRVSPLMKDIPVHVVLNSRVGLIGAAIHAASLMAIGV
ncbi:MAG: glucokinase [Kaiparowitsia implicata GSE-PSE-MK54-09C]|jgi:glucokinase|nr:glucokinase [Kaiparowitsia implicata GSE-PSE-MK54-09C]